MSVTSIQSASSDDAQRTPTPADSAARGRTLPSKERLLIFSRKGFDSSFGGRPSPHLPDGRMVSLPIPEPGSPITYASCRVQPGMSFGCLLDQLAISQVTSPSDGKIIRLPVTPGLGAHLDPDLRAAARDRPQGWRPIFGQADAAQQHLTNQGVGRRDVFVFFGWFRDARLADGRLRYARGPDHQARPRDYHAIWGWMEIGEVLPAAKFAARHPWAINEHPHLIPQVASRYGGANTIYVAAEHLSDDPHISGAGVMRYSNRCMLTMPSARSRRWWELPDAFHPQNTSRPMTYHPPECWSAPSSGRVQLRSACIGQEFVVPINAGIKAWLTALVREAQPW